MEAVLKKFTDPYERKARLYPALVAVLPVIVAVALYTDWLTFDVSNAAYVAIIAGILFWLSGKTRDLGKAVENRLVAHWGGMPSVILLRHRDQRLDKYTKQRYHQAAEHVAGIPLPSASDEDRDPADADERYRAVTSALLSRTRDTTEYTLLFKENINYGFWRNLRGIKPLALVLGFLLVAFSVWHDIALISSFNLPDGPELVVVSIGAVALFAWSFTITDEAVRRAADNYALRLLEALDKVQA
ncbi:hypothetical protein NIT7321_02706 [Phaeobacter italicus]|jgi:hypothetical protein|uniref:SMODS and SLOG-associating 2TM effector domain-containing protein n=1 Tax=Phaeobacter italicus TaxID=481446 RepID=A0A0H5D413_9RHOB|nr:hypothetical protein [Phaeobacter italicus]CRL11836.1 hypothetical protein NIT7321_02706 [Phaeobacter italicus]